MRTLMKPIIAGAMALAALGATAALAGDRSDRQHDRRADYRSDQRSDHRPDFCDVDHDHRSHASNYYDYYSPDKYFRAGRYNGSGLTVSIRVGDRHGDRRYNDRHYRDNDRRYHRADQRRRGRVVNRQSYDTRYRARIVLKEEVVRGRRGNRRLVCTVTARGPEAGYVSKRRMHRIANRNCSPRARVRVYS